MIEIEALLDEASSALLSGDLDALSGLSAKIDAVTALPADRARLERLAAKAARNARLIDAATRGLKAARLRLHEAVSGPTLATYDKRGQKALIQPEASHQIRRA